MTEPLEDEPSEDELREAEALARALEGRSAGVDLPEDALGAAAFLRYAKDGGALDPARAEAILGEALRGAKPSRRASKIRWFGIFSLAALGAAGAVLLVGRPAPPPTALPAPPRALVESEAVAASSAGDLGALDHAMDDYRTQVFATLEERYRR